MERTISPEFTWRHLMRRCDTATRTLRRHGHDVYSVEFSPRGDLLVSTGKDGTVRIWDTVDWTLVRKIVASSSEANAALLRPTARVSPLLMTTARSCCGRPPEATRFMKSRHTQR